MKLCPDCDTVAECSKHTSCPNPKRKDQSAWLAEHERLLGEVLLFAGGPNFYKAFNALRSHAKELCAAIEHASTRPEPERLSDDPQKYDDVLIPFVSLMRKELHANCGKGDRPGWLRMDANTALLEIYWHASKLSAAVKNNDGPAIMEHSADVANMALMVLDICGGLVWVDVCPSCHGTGSQGNGPGVGGCTDCLGTGRLPDVCGAIEAALSQPAPDDVCQHGIHMKNACGACVPPRGTKP